MADNGGGNLSLANIDSTDNNFSNIGGYNSNGLVVSQIDFINKSHSSRTGDIAFLTHNGSVMSERLRITSDGLVGIGTNVPQGELHVKRTSSTGRIIVEGASLAQIGLRDNAGGTDSKVIQIRNNAQNLLIGTQTDSYQSFSEKVRITSAGNIGVGVANPTQKLMVKGIIASEATNSTNNWMAYTWTDNTFRLNYNGAGQDEVNVLSSGEIGLGVDPTAGDGRLQINGGLRVAGSASASDTTSPYIYRTSGYDHLNFATSGAERLRISSTGKLTVTPADTTSSYATTDGGIDIAQTISSTGTSASQSIGIQFSLTKSGQTGAIAEIGAIRQGSGLSALVFRTRDNSTGRNERLRITSGGHVNIGGEYSQTDSKVSIVDVSRPIAEATLNLQSSTTSGAADTGPVLRFYGHSGSEGRYHASIKGAKENGTSGNTAGYLAFNTRPAGGAMAERVRITSDGKTGIGGLTPLNLLNVNATGSMGLYGTVTGKAGHSIRFMRKYGSSATHNFAVVDGASPHGQSRLGGFVATYTFRSAYGFDSDGGGHGVRMLSGRVRDSGEWGFDTETNYGTGDSPRPTLQGVDNNDGTCTLQVVNPGSTHSYGEFHIVAWDCQITTPTT